MEPQIRYVRSYDGTRLATATIGSGPALLMMMPTGLGSIEGTFEIEAWRRSLDAIVSEGFQFTTYDPRGQGLSDRDDADLSMQARVGDLTAVVDALHLAPMYLLARGLTGPTAITYAAQNPDNVRALILWAAPARPRGMRLSPRLRSIAPLIEIDWPLYCQILALIDFGWTETARLAAANLQEAIAPQTLSKNWLQARDHDATEHLGDIRCPTLVVYPKGSEDRVRIEAMREVAAAIPNATFRTSETFSLYWGGEYVDTTVLTDFIRGAAPAADARSGSAETASGTAIILFADIADSTALTERLGDAAFRQKARALDDALRSCVRDSGGAVIDAKTLGDGILATFPAASQAIAAALACGHAGEDAGLPLHLGLHAGDVIRESDNVFGGAVNIAARISALSAPGEVLVSATVRDVGRTSAGVVFEDRGEHALKGIAEPQRVYAVQQQTA